MRKYSNETVVGIFVIVGLLCVGYMTVKLGDVSLFGDNTYSLYARFNSVSGLRAGNTIEMLGIEIGRVAGLKMDQEDLPFKFYRGAGCPTCGQSGYKGRTIIEEVLIMGHKVRELIQTSASTDIIREAAVATGMTPLGQSGLRKVEDWALINFFN